MKGEYEVKSRIKVAFRTIYNQTKRWRFPVDRGYVSRRSPKTLETRTICLTFITDLGG